MGRLAIGRNDQVRGKNDQVRGKSDQERGRKDLIMVHENSDLGF